MSSMRSGQGICWLLVVGCCGFDSIREIIDALLAGQHHLIRHNLSDYRWTDPPPPPPNTFRRLVGNTLTKTGSRGPPPPVPPRRPSVSSGPAARQSRSPVPGARSGGTTKRDDRGVLLTLLYQCSPPPPPGNNTTSTSGWKLSTGWGGGTSLNRWYGVSTRHEDVTAVGSERVTGLMLPGNGVCGENRRQGEGRGRWCGWLWWSIFLGVCLWWVSG